MQCAADTVVGRAIYEIKTRVFVVKGNDQATLDHATSEWESFVNQRGKSGRNGGLDGLTIFLGGPYPRCIYTSEAGATSHIIGANDTTPDMIDWQPTDTAAAPGNAQSPIQSYNLTYQDGVQAGYGYDNASLKLNYRFLACADEIQVAYGIDRKSLEHSDRYVVRPIGHGNMEYATPASQPEAPASVELDMRVTRKYQSTITTVGHLRDKFAGETLGFGCFTGQTQRVGFIKTLVGPNATKPQIQEYLGSLILAGGTFQGIGADFDFPLTNAEFPNSSRAFKVRTYGAKSHLALPPAVPIPDDAPKVADANRQAAAFAAQQVTKMQQDLATEQAQRKAQADYAQAKSQHDAVVARMQQANDNAARDHEAAMADWRAKVAACQASTTSVCKTQ